VSEFQPNILALAKFVFPSPENAHAAVWSIVGAPSDRRKVVADPSTAVRPIVADGFAPVGIVGVPVSKL
jgi:hypothetical protein